MSHHVIGSALDLVACQYVQQQQQQLFTGFACGFAVMCSIGVTTVAACFLVVTECMPWSVHLSRVVLHNHVLETMWSYWQEL
jgi:hypothetical protein